MNTLDSLLGSLQPGLTSSTLLTGACALLLAFACAQVVAWVYLFTHAGISYSRSFVQSLILIALVVAMVMMVVGSNVVIAVGLIGALTVIRFRNVLKDTRDAAFIFMQLVVGLGAGTDNFVLLILGTIFFCLAVLYLHYTGFGTRYSHDALLRFVAGADTRPAFEAVLRRHTLSTQVVSQRVDGNRGVVDYSYRLFMRDPDKSDDLVSELNATQGVSGVSLLYQEDQTEI